MSEMCNLSSARIRLAQRGRMGGRHMQAPTHPRDGPTAARRARQGLRPLLRVPPSPNPATSTNTSQHRHGSIRQGHRPWCGAVWVGGWFCLWCPSPRPSPFGRGPKLWPRRRRLRGAGVSVNCLKICGGLTGTPAICCRGGRQSVGPATKKHYMASVLQET